MTAEEAFQRINNLHVRELLRKYSPQWATVVIDHSGIILDVLPHKKAPTIELHIEHMKRYPNSIQFTTCQGDFSTPDALAAKIKEHVKIAELASKPENMGKKWIKSK